MSIDLNLDLASGVPPYMQLVHQVRRALRLGLLQIGDQLPTIKDVVARVALNPNTVAKAYRHLESEGLVDARPGLGTFVIKNLSDRPLAAHEPLRLELQLWISRARRAGLDYEGVDALMRDTYRAAAQADIA